MAEFCTIKPDRRFCYFRVSLANNMGFRHCVCHCFLRHILLKVEVGHCEQEPLRLKLLEFTHIGHLFGNIIHRIHLFYSSTLVILKESAIGKMIAYN